MLKKNQESVASFFQIHYKFSGEANSNCSDDHWKISLAGSRFNPDAESGYASVEGEALSLVYVLV